MSRAIPYPLGASRRRSHLSWLVIVLVLAACATDEALPPSTTPSTTQAASTTQLPSTTSGSSSSTSVVSGDSGGFPTAVFAGVGEEPVSDELAAELQEVLDTSAGVTGSRRR
jgi:hypothetical protein